MLFGRNTHFKGLQISRNPAELAGSAINSEKYIVGYHSTMLATISTSQTVGGGMWKSENTVEGIDLVGKEMSLMCHSPYGE